MGQLGVQAIRESTGNSICQKYYQLNHTEWGGYTSNCIEKQLPEEVLERGSVTTPHLTKML